MPTLLRMPAVAAGAETALLSEWQVQEGKPFNKTDTIATIETDKAMVDIEAEESGVILRFLADAGEHVEVGAPIALSGVPGETVDDVEGALRALGVQSNLADSRDLQPSQSALEPTGVAQPSPDPTVERVFATPLVRRLARDAGLELATISGTGPNGRILRRDIDGLLNSHLEPNSAAAQTTPAEPARIETPAAAPVSDRGFVEVPHSRMRAAIATRLTQAKQNTPHFYLRGTCRVDELLKLRATLNDRAGSDGDARVSVNDLIVKAAARAHVIVPEMNVVWTKDAVRRFNAVDIAVAVATDGGLLTPVIRDADTRSLSAVSADMRDLAERARLGKLSQSEIEGGSFCISNLGMYGTEEFSAIINPPQSAILAVGAALSQPVVENGEVAIGKVMHTTLSVDHRPIDGSIAAQWMRTFVRLIEDPLQILM